MFALEPVAPRVRHPMMYRVEIEQDDGEVGAYETILRWEAEDYFRNAVEWAAENGITRRIRALIVQGATEVEVIHDTHKES